METKYSNHGIKMEIKIIAVVAVVGFPCLVGATLKWV
jgi:hypothetical protein